MMIPTGTSTINSSTNNSVGSGGIAGASGGVDDTGVTDNSNNSTLKGSGLRPLEATASASSSSHCGSAPPFSTAEYAILDRHPPHTNPAFQHQQQPDHFSPGNNNNDNNSNSNAANGSQSSVHKSGRNALEHPAQQQQQQQHSPHQHSQQYAAQSPYSSAAPTSYASPALSQQQQPHPLFHHQHQQQQPLELQPSHHTNSNSNKWTLGSTDGAYATALALQIEQQQKQELLESSDTILNGSVGGDVPTNSQQQQQTLSLLSAQKSLYQDRLIRQSSSTAVEAVLEASCEVMAFDIAELWLRTGPKTHQLIHSHLRPAALESNNPNNTNHDSDSALLFRNDLVDVYYGEKSSERTHRLSPALCKRAKEAGGVVWVTAHSATGAQALQCSISNVRTAVAVPVCHETSNTNATLIFFSIRRYVRYCCYYYLL